MVSNESFAIAVAPFVAASGSFDDSEDDREWCAIPSQEFLDQRRLHSLQRRPFHI